MRDLLENTKTNNNLASLVLSLLFFTAFLSILALYSPNLSFSNISTNTQKFTLIGNPSCDLFKGRWVHDPKGPRYTNASCSTIPSSKNCFAHGRSDEQFLYWKWEPYECDLPGFEPKTFFQTMRGKKLAFIGDSVARNQVESLLCLLSQEEGPIDVYKDAKDRSRTWFFPRNNFTLMVLWTRFLVKGVEKEGGVFDLHLDQVDDIWAQNVSQGVVDYAIVSDAQWYFKKNYLYEGGKLIGCVECNDSNVMEFGVGFALGKAFHTTLRYINGCKKCKGMVTIARTISPSHFENGTWKTGGSCERSKPYSETEAQNLLIMGSKNNVEWEVRNIQIQEIERAKEEGQLTGNKFEVMDVTKVMLMRSDGHPGSHWRDKKKKGFNDCVHWCMPGPIDTWNDLLLALLKTVVANNDQGFGH